MLVTNLPNRNNPFVKAFSFNNKIKKKTQIPFYLHFLSNQTEFQQTPSTHSLKRNHLPIAKPRTHLITHEQSKPMRHIITYY